MAETRRESSMDAFDKLLQNAHQLESETRSGYQFPKIERNLQQLLEAGQQMLKDSQNLNLSISSSKASNVLQQYGVNMDDTSRYLSSLNRCNTLDPIISISDTNIKSYLKNERENNILFLAEEAKRITSEDLVNFINCKRKEEWQEYKDMVIEEEADSHVLDLSNNSVQKRNAHGKNLHQMTDVDVSLYSKIEKYLSNKKMDSSCLLIDYLIETTDHGSQKILSDTWNLVKSMIHGLRHSQKCSISEKQMKTVDISVQFLQERYCEFLTQSLCGEKKSIDTIQNFVELLKSYQMSKPSEKSILFQDGSFHDVPIWKAIYFAMRSGKPLFALQIAESLGDKYADFKRFLSEMATNPELRLSHSLRDSLSALYRIHGQKSSDVYQKLVLSIPVTASSCQSPAKIPESSSSPSLRVILSKTEDYIWYELTRIWFSSNDEKIQNEMFSDVRKTLLVDCGEYHFRAHQQPFVYVQILLMLGCFQQAVEFLLRDTHTKRYGIHFAMAFVETKLVPLDSKLSISMSHNLSSSTSLNTEESFAEQTLYDQSGLNLCRIIQNYVNDIAEKNTHVALNYISCLKFIHGISDEAVASMTVNLIVDTNQMELILGSFNENGTVIPGILADSVINHQLVLQMLSKRFQNEGMYGKAMFVYDLSKDYNSLLSLLNSTLSQLCSKTINHPNRASIISFATNFADRLKQGLSCSDKQQKLTFFLLLDLAYFFDLYNSGDVNQSLNIICRLKLFPKQFNEVETCAKSLQNYSEHVIDVIPDTLIATMRTIYKAYKQIKNSSILDASHDDSVTGDSLNKSDNPTNEHLRAFAHSLVVFCSVLTSQIPDSVNTQLVEIEVMMN